MEILIFKTDNTELQYFQIRLASIQQVFISEKLIWVKSQENVQNKDQWACTVGGLTATLTSPANVRIDVHILLSRFLRLAAFNQHSFVCSVPL